jgi:hypothetical protein
MQIALDVGQRDVHHPDVQDQHELHEREHRQRPPAPRVAGGGRRPGMHGGERRLTDVRHGSLHFSTGVDSTTVG